MPTYRDVYEQRVASGEAKGLGKQISQEFIDKSTNKMPPTPIQGEETHDNIVRPPKPVKQTSYAI